MPIADDIEFASGTPPLLERDRELRILAHAVTGLRSGAGGAIMVEGPAGIGKTRIAEQVRQAASAAGIRVLRARGCEIDQEFAFGVVRQLFDHVVAGSDPTKQGLLSGAAAQALAVLGDSTGEHHTGNFAALHGLYWLTANLAASSPLILIVDDLHWADSSSLRFFSHLLPRLDSLPVLVVLTSRSQEVGQNLLLARIAADPTCTVLRPTPLSLSGSKSLLSAAFDTEPDADFTRACHDVCAGNPLLINELAQVLAADGLAPDAGNSARAITLGASAITRRVQLWLDRLPKYVRSVSLAIAVLDQRADWTHICSVAEVDRSDAYDAVSRLQSAGLVRLRTAEVPEVPGHRQDRVEFVHSLVRSAVLDCTTWAEHAEAHRKAVATLQAWGAAVEHVAVHLLACPPGSTPDAYMTLRQAAAKARDRGAPDTALSYLRRADQETVSDDQKIELLRDLATAAESVDPQAAASYLARLRDLEPNPAQRAFAIRRRLSALFHLGQWDLVIAELSAAVAELPDGEEDMRSALEVSAVAVALADRPRPGLETILARLRDRPPAAGWAGKIVDAVLAGYDLHTCSPDAVVRARRAVTGETLLAIGADGPLCAAWLTLLVAEDPLARVGIQAAVTHAHRQGAIRAAGTALTMRAVANMFEGNLAEARSDAQAALPAIEAAGLLSMRMTALGVLIREAIEQGDLARAHALITKYGPAHGLAALPFTIHHATLILSRGRLLQAQGHHRDAVDALFACGAAYADFGGDNPAFVPWRSDASISLHELGESEAGRLVDEELEIAQGWGASHAIGRALRVRGLLRTGAAAIESLREAVDVLSVSSTRLEHAKAMTDLAAAHRQHGEHAQSRKLLLAALETAEACGAGALTRKIQTEQRLAGARPRSSSALGPRSLSPSELRVASLASAGSTNRDIAEQLFITTKTVETHISAIFRKLRVASRDLIGVALDEEHD